MNKAPTQSRREILKHSKLNILSLLFGVQHDLSNTVHRCVTNNYPKNVKSEDIGSSASVTSWSQKLIQTPTTRKEKNKASYDTIIRNEMIFMTSMFLDSKEEASYNESISSQKISHQRRETHKKFHS